MLLACGGLSPCSGDGGDKPREAGVDADDRPFLAIWRRHDGQRSKSEAPYLRIAFWNDGRVLFAQDATRWNHNLRQGRLSPDGVKQLKAALLATGAFDLKGTCYLVPSAPCDCVMLDFGSRQQALYWDEVETPGYGINIAPKPQHLKFKECWKEINKLSLEARPKESEEIKARFQQPPDSWYVKDAIQSE